MTTQYALSLFNKATNNNITEESLIREPNTWAGIAINDLQTIAGLTKNLGGELKSRQIIASIIHGAHLQSKFIKQYE